MAVVILFGLLSSTLLNMIVVPVVYLRFGNRKWKKKEEGPANSVYSLIRVKVPKMDVREMRVDVRRPRVLVFMDMAPVWDALRMAVGMVAVVVLVPVFMPFRAMDMSMGMPPDEKDRQRNDDQDRGHHLDRADLSHPGSRTDNPIPKKGAVEKNIWLRVAPSFCAAMI